MAARLTTYVVVAIVAATLIAGLIVGAQREDNDGPVDLIVRNAVVYSADRRGTTAEAVAVRGNQILRVGSNREIARLQRPQTIVVDAAGGTVLPGFNDAHADLIGGGLRLETADLSGALTGAEALERIAAWSIANPASPWVVGRGWAAEHFKNGAPTRQLLDTVVEDRPALMYGPDTGVDSVWVNSRALKLAGINRRTADPVDGVIVREPRTGEPWGVLRGSIAAKVAAMVPPATAAQRAAALQAAVASANALGVTSVQNATGSCAADLNAYDAVRRSGKLSVRVYCATAITPGAIRTEADIAPYDEIRKRYPDDPLFKAGALSIAIDGTFAARSAALLEPYANTEELGEPRVDADDLNRAVRLADAAGWQIITHATGDRGVRLALNAYAHAVRSNRPPARGRRHRIEHLALVDAADVLRFGPLGVVASVQPSMSGAGEAGLDPLAAALGPARAARTFPTAALASQTRLLLGSGWPSAPLSPLDVLDRAIAQDGANPTPGAGAPAGARLELKPALDAYTSSAAWASFDDQRKGSIAAGMLADLVVLSEDLFAAPGKLSSSQVAVTIFDGKIVYRRVPRAETEPAPAPSLQH